MRWSILPAIDEQLSCNWDIIQVCILAIYCIHKRFVLKLDKLSHFQYTLRPSRSYLTHSITYLLDCLWPQTAYPFLWIPRQSDENLASHSSTSIKATTLDRYLQSGPWPGFWGQIFSQTLFTKACEPASYFILLTFTASFWVSHQATRSLWEEHFFLHNVYHCADFGFTSTVGW